MEIMKKEKLYEELNEFEKYEKDWDGTFSSEPIKKECIEAAKQIIEGLENSPHYISPELNGNIRLHWDNNKNKKWLTVKIYISNKEKEIMLEIEYESFEENIEMYNYISMERYKSLDGMIDILINE